MAGYRDKFIINFHSLTTAMSLSWWLERSQIKLFCPVYHLVSDKIPDHIKHLYPVRSTTQFENDLDLMLKFFEPINIVQLNNILKNGNKSGKRYMFLSFDDGLSEMNHIVAPILKKKSVPAVFFINPAFVDNKNLFFRHKASILIEYLSKNKILDFSTKTQLKSLNYLQQNLADDIANQYQINFEDYLQQNKPYLTKTEIEQLIHQGFDIGAHSWDHPQYELLPQSVQIEQTIRSIDYVTSAFQVEVQSFAFPFTDYGVQNNFFRILAQYYPESLTFGCAGLKNEIFPNHIQRVPMEVKDLNAQQVLSAELCYYNFKKFFGKDKIVRADGI